MVPGEDLKRRREALGWSQAELAAKIGYGELSGVRQIQRWESGRTKHPRTPQYYEAVRLLTGVRQVDLADIDTRLRHVEAMLAAIGERIEAQAQTLDEGRPVRLTQDQLRQLVEAVTGTGPFGPDRFLDRLKQRAKMQDVDVEAS